MLRFVVRRPFPPVVRWTLFGLTVIYVAGIWWGVPWAGWAADELPPWIILDAIDRHFSGGWHDKYPPVQYYLNAIVYAPVLVTARAAGLDLAGNAAQMTLLLVSRSLSVVMGLGAVCGIYAAADDLYG